MKTIIHVANTNEHNDNRVFINADLPFAPIKGDVIYLSPRQTLSLKQQLIAHARTKDNSIVTIDYCEFLYGHSSKYKEIENATKWEDKDISFDDLMYVVDRSYDCNTNTFHIEIYSNDKHPLEE